MGKFFCLVLFAGFSSFCFSDDIYNAKIDSIMLDKNYGLKAYIELNKDEVSRDTSCHNSARWEYVLDVSTPLGELIYSNLLVLQSTQRDAHFFGTGTCFHTGIEELRRLEMLN